MKQNNSFGIQFITRTGKTSKVQSSIFVRITVQKQRVELSLKKTIDTDSWNQNKEVVKSGKDAKTINHYIEQVRFRLMECYRELQLEKKELTAETVKNQFLGVIPEMEQESTINMLFKYHNENMSSILSYGTMKNYFTTEKYVKKFLVYKYGKEDMPLSRLNFQFITEFEFFLRNYKHKTEKMGLANNGTMKHLERLNKVARLGVKMQWLDRYPFESFRLKFDRFDRNYLTIEELAKIEAKKFSIQRLDGVKDLFVFSCYTGLAYIDVMKLTPASIIIGIDGGKWLRFSRQKTDIPVNVPLLPQAEAIIEKYSKDLRALEKGTLFPIISNQKLNGYLKELADLTGITKNLTFHLARHTFATSVTLSNGVPIETVSKMLGHTKISTTQLYARVVEKKISEDMLLLKTKLTIKTKTEKRKRA